ncbi:MAG: hypothetical protein CMO81_06105 [Waddliaceae bacterium]|nr:hypothetical protein [Waddliaceae bacterium]
MDYNKLATFVVVAEEASITAAAQRLHRSQSAVSQQIQILEQELGITLFQRQNKRIILTREGEVIFHEAQKHLRELDQSVGDLLAGKRVVEGHIRIGILQSCPPSSPYFRSIASFCKKHEKVRISIKLGTSPEVEEMLLDNQVDLGLLVNFQHRHLFEAKSLQKAEHIVVTSRDYWERCGPFDDLRKIVDADLLDFTENFLCMSVWVKKNAPSLLPTLKRRSPALILADHDRLKSILIAGFGIAVLPRDLVKNEIKAGSLLELLPKSQAIYTDLDIARRQLSSHSIAESLLWEHLLTFDQAPKPKG